MRTFFILALALAGLAPRGLLAQAAAPGAEHVAVEATTLVLDESRASRPGLDALALAPAGGAGAAVGPAGAVRVGARVGDREVGAWLRLLREERAVRRESTQRIVVLSGAPAQLSSQRTLVGAYGQAVSAGPGLWVQPEALEDGRVRLRVWTGTGEVRPGRFGTLEQTVPVEASTEIVVPSGTPVLVASIETAEDHTERGLLRRGSASTATQAWIVVTPRVVDDPARAFPLPERLIRDRKNH